MKFIDKENKMATNVSRMGQWLEYRVRIVIADKRMLVGTFMAYDKYMNLVLNECEEFRKIKVKGQEKEVKRTLGFVVLRGENVLSMTMEAPPPNMTKEKALQPGPGKAAVAGRGAPVKGVGGAGLAAPVRGVGGPAAAQMQPRGAVPGMR